MIHEGHKISFSVAIMMTIMFSLAVLAVLLKATATSNQPKAAEVTMAICWRGYMTLQDGTPIVDKNMLKMPCGNG